MKKEFQNVKIDCWVETEKRLSKKRPCFCVRAESEAVSTALDALSELNQEEYASNRTVKLQAQRASRDVAKLIFCRYPEKKKSIICIQRENDALKIGFTNDRISSIRHAFEAWRNGEEDFCLCPENSTGSYDLWFWRASMP